MGFDGGRAGAARRRRFAEGAIEIARAPSFAAGTAQGLAGGSPPIRAVEMAAGERVGATRDELGRSRCSPIAQRARGRVRRRRRGDAPPTSERSFPVHLQYAWDRERVTVEC